MIQEADLPALHATVVWSVFALGLVLGAVMNRTHFCTMGAIADIRNMGEWTRMRMWLCAIGVAIVGAQLLDAAGLIDVGKSIYAVPGFTWLSYLVGGFLFGFGMVLASGCGSKTLVRIGSGSLKGVVTFLALGLAAYMTLKGVFGVLRVATVDTVSARLASGQDLPRLLAGGDVAAVDTLRVALGVAIGGTLVAFAFAGREFRRFDNALGGVVTGLVIVATWYVSAHLGYLAEDPRTLEEAFVATNSGRAESFSFVSPVAYTLELLMFWSDASKHVTVGIAAVLGMIAGSFLYAVATRSFRWEGLHGAEDTANHLAGGALMGVGGVTALGCTVGQGLSGVSTLSLGSFLALAAIIAGAVAALHYQAWRVERMA